MRVLELRLDRASECLGLDPDLVIQELKTKFPGAHVHSEDKLSTQVQRMKKLLAQDPRQGMDHVLQTLKRNAKHNGPQFSFELPVSEGKVIKGYVQKYVIVLLLDDSLSDEVRNRLLGFLQTFGTGVMKETLESGEVKML